MAVTFNTYAAKYGAVSEKRVTVTIRSIKEKISTTGKKFYTVAGENKFGEMEFFTAFPDQLAKVEATDDDMAPGSMVEIGYVEKPSTRGAPFKNLKSCRPIGQAPRPADRPAERTTSQGDLTDAQIDEICGM